MLLLVCPQQEILPGRLPYDPDAAVSQSSFAQPRICFMCPAFVLELFMHMKLVNALLNVSKYLCFKQFVGSLKRDSTIK